MNSIHEIARELLNRDDYILLGHAIPDGDCIGSLLGLYMGLKKLGKNVQMLLQDAVPLSYHYLFAWDDIKKPEQITEIPRNIVCLDCSDEERLGEKVQKLLQGDFCIINIDHHQTNDLFGDYNYIDAHAAATAEIIYELLIHMGVEITADIATALYAGIIMDTGRFMNGNTTSDSMRIAASLLETGVNIEESRVNLFESKLPEEILLLRQALQDIHISEDGKIAWMVLGYEDVKAIGALDIHPEGIINYTRMIKGVEVGILFREIKPGIIKIGFRSKAKVDVSLLAQKIGGGGHKQAAGARQEGNLDAVKEMVINLVRDVI